MELGASPPRNGPAGGSPDLTRRIQALRRAATGRPREAHQLDSAKRHVGPFSTGLSTSHLASRPGLAPGNGWVLGALVPAEVRLDLAGARFDEALELAHSESPLPEEWLHRARLVGEAPSQTFTPMLATALLAKATNPMIDPFSLKVRQHPRAYSARSLCKDVLVPRCVDAGIDIRTTGAEPLNNQPFFRHERVAPDMAVHSYTRPHLRFLCQCLQEIDHLDGPTATHALAAFLRQRMTAVADRPQQLRILEPLTDLSGLVQATSDFVLRSPEGGRRGQAFVAAALDLVFSEVRSGLVNDPSRHWPGDVAVFEGKPSPIMCVEVKQRPIKATEILQFVANLAESSIHRGAIAALAQGQPALDRVLLSSQAWVNYRVHLVILADVSEVLRASLAWAPSRLDQAVAGFPARMAVRLREANVSTAGIQEWLQLFDTTDPVTAANYP
jgi:hypothetical protein